MCSASSKSAKSAVIQWSLKSVVVCMGYDYRKLTGALVFVDGAQFVLGMLVAEALYPGYSISQNYISDLGAGPSALIFNSSVFLLGLMIVVSAYFVHRSFSNHLVAALLVLAGAGAMGVGVFPENYPAMHEIVSDMAFIFGGLLPIASYRLVGKPFGYLSVVMGGLSLSAMVVLSAQYSFSLGEQYLLGLGPGGMERMIVYPILLWAAAFGGYLMASS
jgi:hypothetical membrane protein